MLLDLPTELRSMIYRCLYQSPADEHSLTPDVYGTRHGLDNPLGRAKKPTPMMTIRRSGLGLILTCKQIREEATDILYGTNTFLFTETMHPVRANSALEFPENKQLLDRLLWYGGMNDMLQMQDFFHHIGPLNLAKIRHIKFEIDIQSVFLGYVRFPINYRGYSGYSAINSSGMLSHGGRAICDAINMIAAAGGLTSFEICRSRNLLQHSHHFEFKFLDPKRLDSDDHSIQYPSYGMFEMNGLHGIDTPLGRSIRSLKGVELICRDIGLWDHGKCGKSAGCRVCMQIEGFKTMQKEMLKDSVSFSLALQMLD